MRFAPHTDDDIREMLATIGAGDVDDLFEAIPPDLRLSEPLDLPPGISEQEVVDELGRLAMRNRSLDELVCFAGRGAYDHYIPSVVWALAGRSEFSTAASVSSMRKKAWRHSRRRSGGKRTSTACRG